MGSFKRFYKYRYRFAISICGQFIEWPIESLYSCVGFGFFFLPLFINISVTPLTMPITITNSNPNKRKKKYPKYPFSCCQNWISLIYERFDVSINDVWETERSLDRCSRMGYFTIFSIENLNWLIDSVNRLAVSR